MCLSLAKLVFMTSFHNLNIQGDSDVFNIKQNFNGLYQEARRFSYAFFETILAKLKV